jgi:glucose-1-phosphate adenylyltransferase
VGSDSLVRRAIVDKNARIGRGVRIVNESGIQEKDADGYFIREGIVVVPKGGVVPDGAVI